MFEELRFRATSDIRQMCPPRPERDARLAMLDVTIERAIRHEQAIAGMWDYAEDWSRYPVREAHPFAVRRLGMPAWSPLISCATESRNCLHAWNSSICSLGHWIRAAPPCQRIQTDDRFWPDS